MKQIKLTDQEGIIGFWESIGKYTVNIHLPETIDSMLTCILPDERMLPAKLRKPGTKILLTAVVTESDPELPRPVLGGQKIVEVLEIEKAEPM